MLSKILEKVAAFFFGFYLMLFFVILIAECTAIFVFLVLSVASFIYWIFTGYWFFVFLKPFAMTVGLLFLSGIILLGILWALSELKNFLEHCEIL